jgi:hypothetical protein
MSAKDKTLDQMAKAFPFVKVDLMGGKGQKAAGGEGNYDLSRYRPPLQYIMKEALEGKLSEVDFPLLSEKSNAAATQSSPAPKARGKATWAAGKPAAKSENKAPPRAGPRLFVFVVGGTLVSFSFSFSPSFFPSKSKTKDPIILFVHFL